MNCICQMLFYAFISVVASGYLFGAPNTADGNDRRIELYQTESFMQTPVNLPCENFENGRMVWKQIIKDSATIDRITETLDKAKPAKQYSLNTRGKMYIFHLNGQVDTVCFSLGKRFKLNSSYRDLPHENFFEFIEEVM